MPLGGRVYLDTNVFISAFENSSELGQALKNFILNAPAATRPPFVTSALTFAELLVKPIRARNEELLGLYDNLSHTSELIEVVPVVGDVLFSSAVCRAAYGNLKLPDAIHIATAAGMHCNLMLTSDTRLVGSYSLSFRRRGMTEQYPPIAVRPPDFALIEELARPA